MELQTNVVKKETLELLKKLMQEEIFKEYFLVGGTALALNLGHRISVDIDMFTRNDIPVEQLQKELQTKYNFKERFKQKNTLKGVINNVEVDFIKYDYNFIKPIEEEQDIRFTSIPDIIAMKLSAITDNGTRMKDFLDIAYLSSYYSLNEMTDFYNKKFQITNKISVSKALIYFNDVNNNDTIELIKGKFSWEKTKKRLIEMTQKPNEKFPNINMEFSKSQKQNLKTSHTRKPKL